VEEYRKRFFFFTVRNDSNGRLADMMCDVIVRDESAAESVITGDITRPSISHEVNTMQKVHHRTGSDNG